MATRHRTGAQALRLKFEDDADDCRQQQVESGVEVQLFVDLGQVFDQQEQYDCEDDCLPVEDRTQTVFREQVELDQRNLNDRQTSRCNQTGRSGTEGVERSLDILVFLKFLEQTEDNQDNNNGRGNQSQR